MSAGDKMERKSQAALEWIMTYGWAILIVLLIVLIAIGSLAYFGIINPEKSKQQQVDIVIDSEPELQDICNKLVVNNDVYHFLEVMGNGLKNENNAQFVAYKFPAELRSDLDIFNVDGLILCGVPAELCYNENNGIKGGTYCLNWVLEVPVLINEFNEWYQKVSD